MKVRNLTMRTDAEFLQQSTDAMLAAIASGNAVMAGYWAEHAAAFVNSCIDDVCDALVESVGRVFLKDCYPVNEITN